MSTPVLGSVLPATIDANRFRRWYEEAFDVARTETGFSSSVRCRC